jgi:GT2 family glycosyltransferase
VEISIIIVNYNVKYFLEQCLCSIGRALQGLSAEVFVIDNASTDGSVDYLEEEFPDFTFIANTENKGFAKANNQVLNRCTGRYVLYLNPDTIVPEDCFRKCIAFLDNTPDAGALGVRMIDGAGQFLPESKRAFPSPVTSFFKLTGLSSLFPSSAVFSRYSLGHLSQYQNHVVDVLAGAFIMARRDLLQQLGGFDESFFMYGEDVDLSYRIQQLGFKNYYFAQSTIIHFKGESTRKGSLNYVRMFYRAMAIFVQKHYGGSKAKLYNMGLQTAIGMRAFVSTLLMPARYVQTGLIKLRSPQVKKIILVGESKATLYAEKQLGRIFSGDNIRRFTVDEISGKSLYADEVIFCTGKLSYRQSIDLVQNLNKSAVYKWFGSSSTSMVGSSNKNLAGEVYVLN